MAIPFQDVMKIASTYAKQLAPNRRFENLLVAATSKRVFDEEALAMVTHTGWQIVLGSEQGEQIAVMVDAENGECTFCGGSDCMEYAEVD